jgi:hypothetical protein
LGSKNTLDALQKKMVESLVEKKIMNFFKAAADLLNEDVVSSSTIISSILKLMAMLGIERVAGERPYFQVSFALNFRTLS